MLVCCKCRIEMTCDKNSVGALFGEAHVYPADRFICPQCGYLVLKTNPSPIFDPQLNTQDEYLKIEQKGE